MQIIAYPHEQNEVYTDEGEMRTVLNGRVPEVSAVDSGSIRWRPGDRQISHRIPKQEIGGPIRGSAVDESVKYQICESQPTPLVEYYPEGRILLIDNCQKSAAGEEMSESIIVHYDTDEHDIRSLVVAVDIDSADFVLRPFADAILAKYGIWREPESDREREARLKTEGSSRGNGEISALEVAAPGASGIQPGTRQLIYRQWEDGSSRPRNSGKHHRPLRQGQAR